MNALRLHGAMLADGIAPRTYRADILIQDGRITRIEALADPGAAEALPAPADGDASALPPASSAADTPGRGDPPGTEVVDVTGLLALPGLVDPHVHADATLGRPEVCEAMTRQGITSVVVGADGLSYAPSRPPGGHGPLVHDSAAFVAAYFAAIDGTHPTFRGGSVAELLETYEGASTVNVAYLLPHGTLRHGVMGAADRPAGARERAAMVAVAEEAFDQGARGLSTGLEYAPACWAERAELVELCRAAARHGLVHASHMRGYEAAAPAAIGELVELSLASGVATHVSHLHGPAPELTAALGAAREAGVEITFDSYPYLRGASILALVALPTWLPLADPEAALAALSDPQVLHRLRTRELPARAEVWPRVRLSFVPAEQWSWAEGMDLLAVAERAGLEPGEAALRLLVDTGLQVGCVFAQPPTNSAGSVRALARTEGHCAASDGIHLGSAPHPRAWGAFARWMRLARQGLWTWPETAVHLARRAADRFALTDRGRLAAGAWADIALIDPQAVGDRATYASPRRVAQGVEHVLVAGTFTLRSGRMTGARPGRALR